MDGKAILAKKIKDDQRQEDKKKSVLVGGKANMDNSRRDSPPGAVPHGGKTMRLLQLYLTSEEES